MNKHYRKPFKAKPSFPLHLKEAEKEELYDEYQKYVQFFTINMKDTRFEIVLQNGELFYEYLNSPLRYKEWLLLQNKPT